jgi:superfamily II DNA or RNA helicase
MEKVSKGDRVEVKGRRGTVISSWEHEDKRIYLVHFDDGQKGYVRGEDIELAKDALERLVNMDLDDFIDFVLYIDATRLLLEYAYNPYVLASTSKIDVVPHQVGAVARMVSIPTPRFLLADDVGLGKTIEAGMVLEELKERGVIRKVLLIVPAALARQWKREMEEKFGAHYVIVDSEYVRTKRKEGIANPFEAVDNAIISMDYAKKEHIKDLICKVPWDIVIIDEAHKLSVHTKGASIEKTDRYRLGEDLAPRTKSLILLTATPHNGDDQDFTHRLMLLNPYLATSGSLDDLMIRRLKEDVYRFEWKDGRLVEKPIFPERKSETIQVSLSSEEKDFYEDLTEYIKASFKAARERLGEDARFQSVVLALMILQRRAASSFHAAGISLQNRINRIKERAVTPEEAQELLDQLREAEEEGDEDKVEELRTRLEGVSIYTGEELQQEKKELEKLRDRAKLLEVEDSKAKRLLKVLETVKRGDPEGKVLIFTEYRDTLEYLQGILIGAGYTVASIHGGMDYDTRVEQEAKFNTDADFMVATDAAGEGLNLQFSNIVINYELPWNPNRLEQRIGRVHRYGQSKNVFVYNFLAADTIEERVWNKVLEKLETIRNKLGDRVFDVLGRIVSEKEIHQLYRELLLAPKAEWEAVAREIEERIDEKLDFLEQIERLLIRHKLSPEEFKAKYTIDLEKTVDEEEVKRFIDIYVRRHGGKVTPVEDENLVDIVLPQSVLGVLETPVIRGSFNKRIALNKGVDYIALGNKAVMAMVRHASEGTDKAAVLKSPKLSKGILLFYKAATVDRLQNIHDEKLLSLFYDTEKSDIIEIDPRAIWDHEPLDGNVKPDPDLIYIAKENSTKALEKIIDRLATEAERKAGERAKRKREAALMHYTKLIEDSESRIKEYEKRAITEPHFKGLAAAERKKVEAYLKDQSDALSLIEKEAELSPTPPELIATAIVLPSAPKEEEAKKIAKAEEMKRKVENAGMNEAMKKETEEGRVPIDVSKEFRGYDVISFLPKTVPKEGAYPLAVNAERIIEVKAFKDSGDLELSSNEWDKARRWQDKYWLYVVENALTEPKLFPIRNPYKVLRDKAEKVTEITYKWVIKNWKHVIEAD